MASHPPSSSPIFGSSPHDWSPTSWTSKPVVQDVTYNDQAHLNMVLRKLKQSPPLVSPIEIDNLRSLLEQVASGNRFLLHGGDCAELFEYCSADPIENKLRILLQMSLVLTWGARIPIVRIARMAGQYAKPRSQPTELLPDGTQVKCFRGDNVNSSDPSNREPDPERLLSAYFHSSATLNYIRLLLSNGFADLHHPSKWDLDHVKQNSTRLDYQLIVNRLTDALDYLKTIGVDDNCGGLNSVDMFMSHEGLLLEYESTLTRQVPQPTTTTIDNVDPATTSYYNLGTHFLWVGDRTRQLNGAHLEYFRGIRNPIGIKVGPSMDPNELVQVIQFVNPGLERGKVTLITRYGATKVQDYLPGHIQAVQSARLNDTVVWCCDPMHGNTISSSKTGCKTRDFGQIVHELSECLRIHKSLGSRLGGVHLELTGDSVTECVGGSMELTHDDLAINYQSQCDPRLNYEQSLDLAFLIAKYFENERSGNVQL